VTNASGKARILHNPQEEINCWKGEILVTDLTNPDWDPIFKKAAIITNKGGRTSHAAIVARELGTVAVSRMPTTIKKRTTNHRILCRRQMENVYNGKLE
jgi:pyruvate,water dikinase